MLQAPTFSSPEAYGNNEQKHHCFGDTMKSLFVIMILATAVSSCSTIYYSFWEAFGTEKRELLRDSIKKSNDIQEDTQSELQSALDRIRSEYKFDESELERTYDKLSSDYEAIKRKSESLSNRIDKVEDIANDLFGEWKDEAEEISNSKYKKESLKKREKTMTKFGELLKSMRNVEGSLKPFLVTFNDQVLFLKHNLNAKSLGAFKTEFRSIEKELSTLSQSIKKSSKEAEDFIDELK